MTEHPAMNRAWDMFTCEGASLTPWDAGADARDAQRAIERAADAAVKVRVTAAARLAAAQVVAFLGLDDPGDTPAVIERTELAKAAGTIWACPNGHATVNVLESRKGRVYAMCTTCHEWERAA
jgi:hypothetical protein